MKQMTAVEWLVKIYLQTKKIDSFDIEQAKAMEKEQIKRMYSEEDLKEAYKSCYTPLSFGKIGDLDEDFKEWFKQFKKEDKQ